MGMQQNIEIAQAFLSGMGSGQHAVKIAAAFAEDLVFDIQGDKSAMPWVGHKLGRQALVDFVHQLRALTEPLSYDVEDFLASESRVAVVGLLQTRLKSTGKIISTQFALVLTITNDFVTRFQMLEDSYAISEAAR